MPRFPDITCPDCKGNLIVLRLGNFIDVPNNYRTMVYTCIKCSKKTGFQKIIFLKKIKLALKRNTKLQRLPTIAKRNYDIFRTLKHHFVIPEKQKPIKYCMHCKIKLYYDRFSSFVRGNNMINIRTYYHLNCQKTKDIEPVFTFIGAMIGNVETLRVIEY